MNNMRKQIDLKVYYDGLCKVCNKEMQHYRVQEGADRIEFIDICSPGFDAVKEGLDPFKVHKVMHARKTDGTVVTRVAAFIEIWNLLPKYRWVSRWVRKPIIRQSLEIGYTCFATLRPILPRYKKSEDCSESPYCEVKNV